METIKMFRCLNVNSLEEAAVKLNAETKKQNLKGVKIEAVHQSQSHVQVEVLYSYEVTITPKNLS